jgi:arylsulfatase A-like enzyme
MKNSISILILVVAICLFSQASLKAQTKEPGKPNIIIIFADDMGYGDVSYFNPYARTSSPHIDRLARNGVSFSNAHATASVCTPSRYGLLTGRYAWRSEGLNVDGFGKPVIEKGRETIASFLQRAGYTTAAIGKWHLGWGWQTKDGSDKVFYDSNTGFSNVDYTQKVTTGPNDYGFDYSFMHPASLDMPPYVFLRNHLTVEPEVVLTSDIYQEKLDNTEYSWDKKHTRAGDVYWEKGVWWRRGEISSSFRVENVLPDIVDDGIYFIEKNAKKKSKPFFLYLPLTGPHTPWMPTKEFQGKSELGTYGDFVMNIDNIVGRITSTLERLDIANNTIVVFVSDNGAYWPESEVLLTGHHANRGSRGQKGDVWDGGHHVPLIISWPARIKDEAVYDHLVSLTDLFATFADLSGQELHKNDGEDSSSFLHVLDGNTNKITRNFMIHHSSGGMYGIRMDGWKFINGLGSGGFTAPRELNPEPDGPTGQLYQIERDPLESTNLFFQRPDIVKKLRKELNEQIKAQ